MLQMFIVIRNVGGYLTIWEKHDAVVADARLAPGASRPDRHSQTQVPCANFYDRNQGFSEMYHHSTDVCGIHSHHT